MRSERSAGETESVSRSGFNYHVFNSNSACLVSFLYHKSNAPKGTQNPSFYCFFYLSYKWCLCSFNAFWQKSKSTLVCNHSFCWLCFMTPTWRQKDDQWSRGWPVGTDSLSASPSVTRGATGRMRECGGKQSRRIRFFFFLLL